MTVNELIEKLQALPAKHRDRQLYVDLIWGKLEVEAYVTMFDTVKLLFREEGKPIALVASTDSIP